jgi:hypothetical protein
MEVHRGKHTGDDEADAGKRAAAHAIRVAESAGRSLLARAQPRLDKAAVQRDVYFASSHWSDPANL